jgi:hypothetical protein
MYSTASRWSAIDLVTYRGSIRSRDLAGNVMDHNAMAHKLGFRKYIQLIRKANADAGPSPQHCHVSSEEQKQCAECQEWQRLLDASFERVFGPYEDKGEKAT